MILMGVWRHVTWFSTFGLLGNPTARHTAQKWSRINWIDWSVDSVAVTSSPPKNDQKASCPHQPHYVPICSMMFPCVPFIACQITSNHRLKMGGPQHTQLSGWCRLNDPKPLPQRLAAVRGYWWLPFQAKKKAPDRSCTHPYTPLRSSATTNHQMGLSENVASPKNCNVRKGTWWQILGLYPIFGQTQIRESKRIGMTWYNKVVRPKFLLYSILQQWGAGTVTAAIQTTWAIAGSNMIQPPGVKDNRRRPRGQFSPLIHFPKDPLLGQIFNLQKGGRQWSSLASCSGYAREHRFHCQICQQNIRKACLRIRPEQAVGQNLYTKSRPSLDLALGSTWFQASIKDSACAISAGSWTRTNVLNVHLHLRSDAEFAHLEILSTATHLPTTSAVLSLTESAEYSPPLSTNTPSPWFDHQYFVLLVLT